LGSAAGWRGRRALPRQNQFRSVGSFPRRVRPSSIEDTTMPDEVSAAINQAITNDNPDGARLLLDGVDATLSPEARAEWRTRVAWSYFIENMDTQALALARPPAKAAGRGWPKANGPAASPPGG
jgi:soluble lytic murein transglycosylase